MTDEPDDLFAAAGLAPTATPAHWRPITRTDTFDAQQIETRRRLADAYDPDRSEAELARAADTRPPSPFAGFLASGGMIPFSTKLLADTSAMRAAFDQAFEKLQNMMLRGSSDPGQFTSAHVGTPVLRWIFDEWDQPPPPKPRAATTPRIVALEQAVASAPTARDRALATKRLTAARRADAGMARARTHQRTR